MSLNCESIGDISIGSNYGGKPYDLKIDVSFNSPSVFVASFVSANGAYSISAADLNAESPEVLSVGGQRVEIYPVSYKIQSSPSGKLLMVKYIDSSHIYLDKYNVVPDFERKDGKKTGSNSRFLDVIPVKPGSGDLELGKYSPKQLYDKMAKKGIPMDSSVRNVMTPLDTVKKGKAFDENSSAYGIVLDAVGSLRDALATLGNELGILFIWDWSSGGKGRLTAIDPVSRQGASSLATAVRSAYEKYISNFDESFSIEDNYSNAHFMYDTNHGETSFGGFVSQRRVRYHFLNVEGGDFWKKPFTTADVQYFTKAGLKAFGNDWLKLCSAALMGEEYFRKYIFFNLAANAAAKDYEKIKYRGKDGAPVAQTDSDLAPFNIIVPGLLESATEAFSDGKVCFTRKIFFKPKNKKLGARVEELFKKRAFPSAAVAEIMMEVPELRANDGSYEKIPIKKIRETFGEFGRPTNVPYWVVEIKKHDKFEDALRSLFQTCQLYGKTQYRYALAVAPTQRKDSVLRSNSKGPRKMKRGEFESYNVSEKNVSWIWEKENTEETPLGGLVLYRKQPHFVEIADSWGSPNGDKKPAFGTWIEDFVKDSNASLSNDAKIEEEYLDGFSEDKREGKRLDMEGYILVDKRPDREKAVIDDLKFVEDAAKYRELEVFAIGQDTKVNDILGEAIKTFEKPEKGFSMTYRKVAEPSSTSYSNFDMNFMWEKQDDKNTVSNKVIMTKAPEVEGYAFSLKDWLGIIQANTWGAKVPNIAYTIDIEKLVPFQSKWVASGLESYSIKYSGGDGVTTSLTIGNRKKQKQAMDNSERLVRYAVGNGVNMTASKSMRPSAARGSIQYGMKAFS